MGVGLGFAVQSLVGRFGRSKKGYFRLVGRSNWVVQPANNPIHEVGVNNGFDPVAGVIIVRKELCSKKLTRDVGGYDHDDSLGADGNFE